MIGLDTYFGCDKGFVKIKTWFKAQCTEIILFSKRFSKQLVQDTKWQGGILFPAIQYR